jgi:transcriptional regulator with XRE-family HTH domain
MMVKVNKLAGKIRERGLTQKEIAARMNLSEQSFSRKMQGKARFFVNEVEVLTDLLMLTRDEVREIFFY